MSVAYEAAKRHSLALPELPQPRHADARSVGGVCEAATILAILGGIPSVVGASLNP